MDDQTILEEVYATIVGGIDMSMTQRIFGNFTTAINQGIKRIHLLMHSPGGSIDDAIASYNYLKNLPVEIITYNGGMVGSAALYIFLAGKTRKASKTGQFLIHKSQIPTNGSTSTRQVELCLENLRLQDARIETIIKDHVSIPKNIWTRHANGEDVFISATDALSFGIIDDIHDFQPPLGSKIYNI